LISSKVSPEAVVSRPRVVAVVGASKNPEKEAFSVPLYLKEHGFTVVPVNPTAGEVHGEKAYPSLADLPPGVASRVEVVEVFRPSEELAEVARQAVGLLGRTGKAAVFWAQGGLESAEARRILEEAGVPYVMDACMRTVHQSLRPRG
jgi:hypothetical protein